MNKVLIYRLWAQFPSFICQSRVAQRKRAGPITQRSMDRNHPLLSVLSKKQFHYFITTSTCCLSIVSIS